MQLFVALDLLSYLGILHTDIKPNNIMLVNRWEQPLRVKLIDFGLAVRKSDTFIGKQMQATGFRYHADVDFISIFSFGSIQADCSLAVCLLRAPEVSLGLPITEAIDLWGLGCTLAYLFLGEYLFSIQSEFQMVLWRTSDDTFLRDKFFKSNFIHLLTADETDYSNCGAAWWRASPRRAVQFPLL